MIDLAITFLLIMSAIIYLVASWRQKKPTAGCARCPANKVFKTKIR